MKKQISFIILLLLSINSWAQRDRVKHLTTFDDKVIHFGFTLGINTMDFGLEHWTPIGGTADEPNTNFLGGNYADYSAEVTAYDTIRSDISSLVPGFTVGIVTNLRLGEYVDLRFLPGLSFGERRLVYNVPIYDNSVGVKALESYSMKSIYIDFPLLIKYKSSRINNQRPYVIAGGAFRYDISKSATDDLVPVQRGGFYLEAGIGWDSYLTFFKLSTELKVSLGLGNMLCDSPDETQRQYYSAAIKKLTSNVFTLCFHFE